MARTDTLTHYLTDVADAIREKTGSTDPIQASSFDTAIENIPSGGKVESLDDLNNQYLSLQNHLLTVANNYTPYSTDNITLYTPNSDYKNYVIYKSGSGTGYSGNVYRVAWFKTGSVLGYHRTSNTGQYLRMTVGPNSQEVNPDNKFVVYRNGDTFYRTGEIRSSGADAISAISNPDTSYKTVSSTGYVLLYQDPSFPNLFMLSNMPIVEITDQYVDTFTQLPSQKISSNETIEVKPSS